MRRLGKPCLWSALLLVGCDFERAGDVADVFEPVIQVDERKVTVVGLFLDAKSGRVVDQAVNVTFGEEGATLVEDLFGAPITSMTTQDGAVSLSLSNAINPVPGSPVELRILATSEGYRPSATRISMSRTGWHEFRLLMDRESDPLAQPVRAVRTLDLSGDVLLTPEEVTVRDLTQVASRVRFPVSTRFLDRAGQAATGTVRVSLGWVPPSARTIATFPGGLDAGVRLPGRRYEPSTMTTGGLVEVVTSSSNGESLTELEGPAELEILVDASLLNPNSNATVMAGDRIGSYRWLPEAGLWDFSGEATLTDRDSRLFARWSISRSGIYSIGYRTVHCGPGRLLMNENVAGVVLVAYRGTPADADGIRVWRFPPGESEVTLDAPPDFWRGTVQITHGQDRVELPYDGLCGRTFEAEFSGSPQESETLLSLEPIRCTALRVTSLPTLVLLTREDRFGGDGLEAWLDGPYVSRAPNTERDMLGRAVRFTASVPPRPGSAIAVLGSRAWTYPGAPRGGVLDFSDPAEALGLCVTR